MKKIILSAIVLFLGGLMISCSNASANGSKIKDTEVEKAANKEEVSEVKKVAAKQEYVASIAGWNVGLEEVYKMSKETGKPIMANFTGSDWCGWCHRLKASVFDKPKFKTWAAENVILYEVDFPRGVKIPQNIAQENAGLQQSLQVRGYPTVFIFNMSKVDGRFNLEPLGKLGYEPTAEGFITKSNNFLKAKK